jgi:hypothetical protein
LRNWRWLREKATPVVVFINRKSKSAFGCRGRSLDRSICTQILLHPLDTTPAFTFMKLVVIVHHEVLARNASLSKGHS